MDVLDFDFQSVDAPTDTVPVAADVIYPCKSCGREAGPYSGRGRKPTVCSDCKPKGRSSVRLTGSAQNLATQAAKTLVQINSMIGMLAAAVGLFNTASTIVGYQELFEPQAFAALSTDPELCKAILRTGSASAKVSLVLAYGGQAVAVMPVAAAELKARKEARVREAAENDNT